MNMTLEEAQRLRDCAMRLMDAPDNSVMTRTQAKSLYWHWIGCVNNLEAAEKAAEKPQPTELDERFGLVSERMGRIVDVVEDVNAKVEPLANDVQHLSRCVGSLTTGVVSADAKIEQLEARFDRHEHGVYGKSGPPINDLDPCEQDTKSDG